MKRQAATLLLISVKILTLIARMIKRDVQYLHFYLCFSMEISQFRFCYYEMARYANYTHSTRLYVLYPATPIKNTYCFRHCKNVTAFSNIVLCFVVNKKSKYQVCIISIRIYTQVWVRGSIKSGSHIVLFSVRFSQHPRSISRYTMANFGELVLLLGDLRIPQRAPSIPEKFKR